MADCVHSIDLIIIYSMYILNDWKYDSKMEVINSYMLIFSEQLAHWTHFWLFFICSWLFTWNHWIHTDHIGIFVPNSWMDIISLISSHDKLSSDKRFHWNISGLHFNGLYYSNSFAKFGYQIVAASLIEHEWTLLWPFLVYFKISATSLSILKAFSFHLDCFRSFFRVSYNIVRL